MSNGNPRTSLSQNSVDSHHHHHPKSTSSASTVSRSSSSTNFISPNHPDELKKQPLPEYDPHFTIKSYIGAAETLLEKAKSHDVGGQLESAFVNYRKAAAIIQFCSEAKDLRSHKVKADETWRAFKALQHNVWDIVERCKRIEELLIERENRIVSTLKEGPIAASSSASPKTVKEVEDEPKSPPLTGISSNQSTVNGISNAKTSHKDDSHLISADSSQPQSLAARLASLRNSGIESGTTSAGIKRMSKQGLNTSSSVESKESSPQNRQNGFHVEGINGSQGKEQEPEEDETNEEERRKQLENLRLISASPELSSKHDNFSLHRITEDLRRDVARGRDVVGESGYSRGDETPEYRPHQLDDNEEENESGHDNAEGDRNGLGHIPTASEFNSQYPTLDDFEKDEDLKNQLPSTSSNHFPSIPTHSVGPSSSSSAKKTGPSRPLPNPPVRPDNSDFNLIRDGVPQSFNLEDDPAPSSSSSSNQTRTTNPQSNSTSTHTSESTRSNRTSRPPAPPIPTSTKPTFIPSSSKTTSSSTLPMPGSGVGEVGTKPRPPPNPYITSEELYKYLHPGFERIEVEPGVSRIASRVGLEILLLDVRIRDEFEKGRIKAKNSVCLEPLILKDGITCEEIEDKILISPYDEQINWSNRGKVDLVVIYDECSRKFGQESSGNLDPRESLDIERINTLYHALTERNYNSPLKNKPVILIGGMESWIRNIKGEQYVTRTRREIDDSSNQNDHSKSGYTDMNGIYSSSSSSSNPPKAESTVGGRNRYSTAYDSGTNFGFGGPKESPDSRSSLDISRMNYSSSSSSDETKRARRQVHMNGINDLTQGLSPSSIPSMPNPHFNSSLPAALIPARSPLSNPTGFSNTSSFSNLGSGLPMPARAYQSGGASSSPSHPASASLGTPSGRMRANDDYFQQPHSTYGSHPNSSIPSRPTSSRQNSISNPNFDYPTLTSPSSSSSAKSNSYQSPQQSSVPHHSHSHSHSSSISSNHQSLSHPAPLPTAAVANGISARAPHQSSTASPSPSSGTRSPIPPIPNQSNSITYPSTSSTDLTKRPSPSQSLSNIPNRGYYGQVGHIDQQIHIGMTGLKNVGNSCYMNSTLQCLSASLPLANFMLSRKYKEAINKVNPLGTQGALANAFAGLINVLWSEQYTFVSPVTFREAITKFAPSFRGYDQHDSQEFLVFLLDGLHEDLNYVVNKPPPLEISKEREMLLETLPQQIASVQEWDIYRRRNNSIIVDQFQGQFRNKMTCLTCGTTSTTYNAFVNLSLPIPHGKGITRATLQQCLDAFVKEEVMDKADAWNCPKCKKPRKATKRLSISRLPKLLLIHLKRFSFKGPFTDKIETKVEFPKQGLDLTNYMPPPLPPGAIKGNTPISISQQPPYLYDLYAVTHHFGSLNTGHYTATIRNDGAWWYYDDSVVSKKDERHLNTNSPYVLWFRRRMG